MCILPSTADWHKSLSVRIISAYFCHKSATLGVFSYCYVVHKIFARSLYLRPEMFNNIPEKSSISTNSGPSQSAAGAYGAVQFPFPAQESSTIWVRSARQCDLRLQHMNSGTTRRSKFTMDASENVSGSTL